MIEVSSYCLGLTKNINQQFYRVMRAYCLAKLSKFNEALESVQDSRQNKPNDPIIAKYLAYAYNDLGLYSEATALLEYVLNLSTETNEELSEELFFSYVRENKLLKQQN